MERIREIAHRALNRLNNISLIAGAAKFDLQDPLFSEAQRQERDKKISEYLQKIEDNVAALAKELEELVGLVKEIKNPGN